MPSARKVLYALACLATIGVAGAPAPVPAAAERDERLAGAVSRIVHPIGASERAEGRDPDPVQAPTRVVAAALSSAADVPAAPEPDAVAFVPPPDGARNVPSCRWPGAATLAAILPVAADNGSHASGVVVAPGRVLTAAHAVQGASRFFVRVDEDFRTAQLMFVDHENDLAVLAVETPGIEPIALASDDPGDRQPVWAAGYPRAQAMTTSVGVFQKHRDGALHTSAPIDSGQSGGGLLGCSQGTYRLVGLLRGYGAYLSGDRYVKLENHSVSVAATTIRRFLDTYR